MLILRRFGPFFCSLKRVHADIFMLACALFNEQNKGPILLSIITWFILGKQNVQAKKVYLLNKLTNSTVPSNTWLKYQSRDYFPRHSGVQRRKTKKRIHFGHQNSLQTYTFQLMPSTRREKWDCLELTPQKQHSRRALWNSNNTWGHAAILKQS